MSTLSVTPDLINTALSQTNFIKSNGYLSDYNYLYLTVTDASVQSLDELKNVIVSYNSKRVVRLEDIADIQINESVEFIKINANGKESLLIGVDRKSTR